MHPTAEGVSAAAASKLYAILSAAVARKGAAVVALSGGSAAAALSSLPAACAGLDWSRVHVFLADERLVAPGDPESNATALRASFADAVGLPPSQLYEVPRGAAIPDAAAAAYEALLDSLPAGALERTGPEGGATPGGLPAFDAVVLGVGPDGHTASLFPNSAAMTAPPADGGRPRAFAGVRRAPKPPADRVTLTPAALNAARHVLFLATGAAKAEVVQRVLEVQALPGALPAQSVRPQQGDVTWLLDAAAAKALRPREWDAPAAWPRSAVPAAPK